MQVKNRLLIATSNEGKVKEIEHFLKDLPFEIISLKDLDKEYTEPEETGSTLEANAILKAKYYAEKTNYVSLADDGGIFIDALDGWPGVKSARAGNTDKERINTVLQKMSGIENRKALFRVSLALYNPKDKVCFISNGEISGSLLNEPAKNGVNNFGYNTIFFVEELNKTYSEMSLQEKNSISHRGKALSKIKYYLQNQYSGKNIVVPIALIIKDGKILSTLRNDPHRPQYHKKWEFPGGSIEMGEKAIENLVRETREETGYEVEVIKLLQHIYIDYQKDYNYQVYLLPYLCKIKSGDGSYNDAEVMDIKFFELDDLLNQDLIDENNLMLKELLPELKDLIKEHNL
jgi:XTP/dITP diphosphohydrolase